jgi:hypothetical protein
VNSVSLAGQVASLLPNTTAAAADSPQACGHSCTDYCGGARIDGHSYAYYRFYLCCASGCWSQGCECSVAV